MNKASKLQLFMTLIITGLCAVPIAAQTTAFTYQGKLTDSGNPANGNYDFQFKLFDALSGGTQQGAILSQASVAVSGGIFNVTLDFGTSVFTGEPRYLEISVKPAGSPGGYQQLLPRQPINSTPYAINARQLGGLAATRYVATDTNGNVGIGTPSAAPGYKVDINSNGGGVRSFYNGSTHFVAETTGGTNAWAKFIMKTPNRQWAMGTSQNFNGDQLYIADDTAGQIRMAIATNGSVGIGTDAPVAKLHVNGGTSGDGVRGVSINGFGVYGQSADNVGVYGQSTNGYAGYFSGNVFVSGTVTQGSDARLKQNISKLGYGLAEVLRLRPVTWRWKAHPERGEQLGLVAQEVEPVLPELVLTSKDAEQMKGLNYTGLVPVLVNAIQEQQAQINRQAHEINRLKQREQQQSQQQSQIQLRQQIKQQRDEISRLKQLVCLDHPKAALCRKAH